MSKKQTYFRNDWLSNPDFKNWLKSKHSRAAFCVKCNKSIELSNMGEQALRSHMKSKKHLKSMEPINVFFLPRRQPVIEQSTAEPSVSTPPVYQKQLTLVLNSSSAEKGKQNFFGHINVFGQTCLPCLLKESVNYLKLCFQIVR